MGKQFEIDRVIDGYGLYGRSEGLPRCDAFLEYLCTRDRVKCFSKAEVFPAFTPVTLN